MHKYGREYFEEIYDASGEGDIISRKRAEMLLDRTPDLDRVLDVGCGFGDFLKHLQREGIEVSGVDISEFALEKSREKVDGHFTRVDVSSRPLPFSDNFFDAVAAFDLVEHIKSPKSMFLEIHRVLRPGGTIFITTPNGQGKFGKFMENIFPSDPTHVNVKGGEYWCKQLTSSGFEGIEIKAAILHGFPPMYKIRRWFESYSLPIIRRPLFFPIERLCGTLYIIARKKNS